MDWKVSTSHTERYALDASPRAARARAWAVAKNERALLQYVMVFDCADGSHRILDLLLIVGHDRKTKLPTARGVITVGRHEAVEHDGRYHVDAPNVLDYSPICSLHLRAEHQGDEPSPARSGARGRGRLNKSAENTVKLVIEKLARRAHEGNLWLATMSKRNLRLSREGLIPLMKYYGIRDSWRVPLNRVEDYKRTVQGRANLKRSAAWAFEKVETLRGENF